MDSKLNATFYVNLLPMTGHASTTVFCTEQVGVKENLTYLVNYCLVHFSTLPERRVYFA